MYDYVQGFCRIFKLKFKTCIDISRLINSQLHHMPGYEFAHCAEA